MHLVLSVDLLDTIFPAMLLIAFLIIVIVVVYHLLTDLSRKGIIPSRRQILSNKASSARSISAVNQFSYQLRRLRELNQRTSFHMHLLTDYLHTFSVPNKHKLDHLDFTEYLYSCLDENKKRYETFYHQAQDNLIKLRSYTDDVAKIMSVNLTPAEFYTEYYKFGEHEQQLLFAEKLRPVTSFTITIRVSYISPAGKNHYQKQQVYSSRDLPMFFSMMDEAKRKRSAAEQKKQEERSKMTESMRYDVLKRDGFRCVICGASASDGAKLHVDHIMPISKGGKTDPSNLRTLCDRCNLGKRDKYDPNGYN